MRPQPHGGEGKQAGARADIGVVARGEALALHQVEHGEAARRGRVLSGPESLAGGDDEIDRVRIRRIIGRMDVETPGPDRRHALLAFGYPVGLGHLLGHKIGRAAIEQCGDRAAIGSLGFARQPGFEQPVVGMLLVDLAGGEDDVRVPVGRQFLRRQRGLSDRFRDFDRQLPASGHSSPRSRRAWRRSCWRAHPARRIRSALRSLQAPPRGRAEYRRGGPVRHGFPDNRPPSPYL